jgi:YHS domain-containing protein
MENSNKKFANIFNVALIVISCAIPKSFIAQVVIDPVCAMKVNLSESYDYIHEGKKYSFDSYDCKEAFKMNPKKYLENKCTPAKSNIDPVCGLKVDLSDSYDWKYNGKIYYFHSYDCRESFKMNPKKFMENKCAPKDSTKK